MGCRYVAIGPSVGSFAEFTVVGVIKGAEMIKLIASSLLIVESSQ